MSAPRKKIAVIGGGLVGLSTALSLSREFSDHSVIVLEKEAQISLHQSGRNSGVIHSGIYYKPGSLKAINCVAGRRMLVEFCEEHQIPYDLCGKLIVATRTDEIPALSQIAERGRQNGIEVRELSPEEAREIEPAVRSIRALQVKDTGIVDYPGVARMLRTLLEREGGSVRTNFAVTRIANGSRMVIGSKDDEVEVDYFVNCAGLHSDRIARLAGEKVAVSIVPFRGEYYLLRPEKNHLCRHLIYPVPDSRFPFLGVHFTRMISGGVECGPNAVLALKREGYRRTSFDLRDALDTATFPGFHQIARRYWRYGMREFWRSVSKREFTRSLQELIPEITIDDIVPGEAGVRAQAVDRTGSLIDDFLFHQGKNSLHVLNAPSPAATSCLSLGQAISSRMKQIIDS